MRFQSQRFARFGRFAVPPKAAHVAGTAFVYENRLRIVVGRFEAEHRRRRKGEPSAPLPEHRAAKVAAVHGKRAKLYEKRQQLFQLGPGALELLTHITASRAPTIGRTRRAAVREDQLSEKSAGAMS